MFIFSSEYREKAKLAWESCVVRRDDISREEAGVRDEVYDSWKRSMAYGVRFDELKSQRIPESQLWDLRKKNELLLKVAKPYMKNLYRFMRGTEFALVLTDVHGVVLELIRDNSVGQRQIRETGLEVGCIRSEQHAGTNGLSLCLVTGKPIQVDGYEHYVIHHIDHQCSAAPLNDPDGNLIGCIGTIGPMGMSTNHTLAMVAAAADGIINQIRLRGAYDRMILINDQLRTAINFIETGVILVDATGAVIRNNRMALEILQMELMTGKKIFDIIRNDTLPFNRDFLRSDVSDMFVSVETEDGKTLQLAISISTVISEQKEYQGCVIKFEKTGKVHQLTNRVSGFQAVYTFDSIVGESYAIKQTKKIARLAAENESNVLILGESGTGKELFAQAIHKASMRTDKPFIAINCGSLPRGIIESELFGYEGGSFTGASKDGRPGKFELADGGTIFLDEIGDMPLDLQASLLRVLQNKEIIRLGGKKPVSVDVRIIAATNINLNKAVQDGAFREDLYYRLNVLFIEIPPLRERKDDLPVLSRYFIDMIGKRLGKQLKITEEAQDILNDYYWPGNARQLENVIERAAILSQSGTITKRDLPERLSESVLYKETEKPEAVRPEEETPLVRKDGYDSMEQRIRRHLEATYGNVTKAAETMGMPKRTLYRKIRKYNIDLERYR